jgi:hypothetical protein
MRQIFDLLVLFFSTRFDKRNLFRTIFNMFTAQLSDVYLVSGVELEGQSNSKLSDK